MKPRSREINVISMSALDLFASGLGAFIFLALIAIPFAPNLGSSPEDVVKLKDRIAELDEELEETQAELEKAKAEFEKGLQNRATDIAIVIDTTASMGSSISSLKSEIGSFSGLLGKLSERARISVIEYKDRCNPANEVSAIPLTLLDDGGMAQIQRFVDGLEPLAPCNNTGEESLEAGLRYAVENLDWSANPDNQFIVVIGDNSPYPDRRDAAVMLASNWGGQGRKLSAVFVGGAQQTIQKNFYSEIANASSGTFLDGQSSFAVTLLTAMAK